MKPFVTAIVVAAVFCGDLGWGAASASFGKGPKMVEIDEAGNVRTTSGTDIGRATPQGTKRDQASSSVARDGNAAMRVCDPRYRWLPSGVSADTVARARAFYRDVTQPYERAAVKARKSGTSLSRQREIEYWNAYGRFIEGVPRAEREVVKRGVLPRLSWWCRTYPVIRETKFPPPAPLGKR